MQCRTPIKVQFALRYIAKRTKSNRLVIRFVSMMAWSSHELRLSETVSGPSPKGVHKTSEARPSNEDDGAEKSTTCQLSFYDTQCQIYPLMRRHYILQVHCQVERSLIMTSMTADRVLRPQEHFSALPSLHRLPQVRQLRHIRKNPSLCQSIRPRRDLPSSLKHFRKSNALCVREFQR